MNKVLSQEEVNALLNGMSGGDVATGSACQAEMPDVSTFDFADRRSYLQKRPLNLDAINDRFSRLLCVSLCGALRRPAMIKAMDVTFMRFDEFVQALPAPSSLHVFRMEPLKGLGMMVLESSLVFGLLEVFCGAVGAKATTVEGRDFTPIENRLINKVVALTLAAQEKAWEPIHPTSFALERSETNPQFVTIASPEEVFLKAEFAVELDEPQGLISFCIPYSTLEPIREQLGAVCRHEDQDSEVSLAEQIGSHLPQVQVEVGVELGRAQISAGELLELRPGDVIVLEKEFSDPLVGRVEGVPKLSGFAGLWKGKKAFRLSGLYDHTD